MWAPRILLFPILAASWLGLVSPGAAEAGTAAPKSLIVKLRAAGPHAVRACAEARTRAGRDLAGATADASGSLDALLRRHRVDRVRAVFRKPAVADLRAEEQALRQRLRATPPRGSLYAARGPKRDPGGLAHVYRLELARGVDPSTAVADFAADPHVEWAQPNYAVETDRLLDDPFLTSTGSWGQSFADLYGLSQIGAPAAWDTTLGEGSVVAVADTGLELDHPDVAGNLWVHPGEDLDGDGVADPEEWNGIDDDGNGFVDDLHGYDFHAVPRFGEANPDAFPDLTDPDPSDRNGHGSHVSGTAAGRGDNGIGIAGVAPRAKLMAIKVFPDAGRGQTDRIWRGVLYAAENGADVVNGSFSCNPRCPSNPIAEEVVRILRDLGVPFVTSAGNRADDMQLTSPEKLPETIVVGAGDAREELATFSSFGLLVDVVAPGVEVLSLRLENPDLWSPFRFVGDRYMFLNGTSMAAPHVAGVVALLRSADPSLDYDEIRALLRRTAEDAGLPGPDRRFGRGWVRADRALAHGRPADAFGRIVAPAPASAIPSDRERVAIRTRIWGREVAATRLELGVGSEPQAWALLGTPATGEQSTDWDVSALPDDRYVLRLVLTTAAGEEIQELAPVYLDRNRPVFLSRDGLRAERPDVAGDRVVWAAPGPDDAEDDPGLDLYWGRFGTPGGMPLVSEVGDQTAVRLSRRGMAWTTRAPRSSGAAAGLYSCGFQRGISRCAPEYRGLFAASPSLSGSRLVYEDGFAPPFRLLTCRLTGACEPEPATPTTVVLPKPLVSGDRLVWSDRSAGATELLTCRLPAGGGPCTPEATGLRNSFDLVPRALSGSTLVYQDVEGFSLPLEFRLNVCAIDDANGRCDGGQVYAASDPIAADASGGRVVFAASPSGDEPDVFVCRFDAASGRCPLQRLTSHPSRQQAPRIHHHRVVWVDDRGRWPRVVSFHLPTLARPRGQRVAAGEPLALTLRETSGGEAVVFEGWTASGAPVSALGIEVVTDPLSGSVGFVRWTPTPGQVGTHDLRFRAVRPSGLHDERTVRVVVTRAR